jgi:elongation factor G
MASPAPRATAAIRTLALVGPAAVGKTSLAEALLHAAGAIGAKGSVERGNTVADHDPLERRMQHSLSLSALCFDRGDVRVHLLDTPGAPDFIGQSLPALEAVETAAVVIGANTGIEPMARRMMAYAARRKLDRLVIVNRLDTGADTGELLARIQQAFGRECLPVNLPADGGMRVIDCFFNRDGPPTDFSSVEAAHRALLEQVVEVDPGFVERYLEDGDVDPAELHAPLEQALREGHLVPVVFVSARTGAGVRELLDVIERLLPNPAEGNPPPFLKGEGAGAKPVRASPDPHAHVLAHVFNVAVDPYVGKMGILRIHQGTLRRDSQLYVGDGRKPFKVGHLFLLRGKEHIEVQSVVPGDICAIAKVDDMHFDAVLHDAAEDDHIHLKPLDFPVPVHGLAIEPKRRGDEQRMWEILGKLVEEDPCLKVEHVAATNETVVYGLGELHLRMLLERLREVFRFEVTTRPPRIAYRETVTGRAEGHHRHKKQTGGAGQFGEVFLRVEPLPRGAGFEFVDQVKGGVIPGQFMPAVEKGVRLAMQAGVVAGYPVTDVRVVVHDGKHHSVDSKEIAFVTAARKAFMAAVREARPAVLEPVVQIQVSAPGQAIGDIAGDLSTRRGQVTGTSDTSDTGDGNGSGDANAAGHTGAMHPADGGAQVVVRGIVPLAELSGYQTRLNAMTSGQGRYAIALSHYDPVPPAVQQQLVSKYQVREDD